jgi:cyclopropane-fatty-acyl-phospholipid synthase
MFYSCADFVNGANTLEEAQEVKARDVLRMLAPRPGERILDLGCGWGGMLKCIYEATKDKENLFGYTLSENQVAYNQEHGKFNVSLTNFVTTDYSRECFDKVYSIGAWEHVRPSEIPGLAQRLYRAIRPGGRLVQHFICFPADALPTAAIGSQLFFPGSMLAPYRHQIRSFEAAGFEVAEQTLHDYRKTLRAWFDNLVANRERAVALVGVHRYNEFLVFFPAAWRFHHDLEGVVVRIGLERP